MYIVLYISKKQFIIFCAWDIEIIRNRLKKGKEIRNIGVKVNY